MSIDLFSRKQTHFVLWRPGYTDPAPALYIGAIAKDNPDPYSNFREIPLLSNPNFPQLWEIAAQDCGLTDGQVYFYWFKVRNANVYINASEIVDCTDPTAYTVDRRYRRFLGRVSSEDEGKRGYPASVVLYQNGLLIPCDPEGQTVDWEGDTSVDTRPENSRLVIYELPTRWTSEGTDGSGMILGDGTFRDATALIEEQQSAPSFPQLAVTRSGYSYLVDLGINALELLPPEDSDDTSDWGYGTANYFAADFDLGRPDSQNAPTASTDLVNLIKVCHQRGIRFFLDVVMAFSRANSYKDINFLDFYIQWKPKGDPTRDPEQGDRDGFGGDLFKYNYWLEGYHPINGEKSQLVPSREYMKIHMAHWIDYYRIDGLRLDSVNNIGNYDFIQEFKDLARKLWADRGGTNDKFLVVGEELSVPLSLIYQNRLDGLWNERFKQIVRQVILGKSSSDEPSFEWSVRKLIDCRLLGFQDGTQAINYLTSHDVGGYGNERFYNYLVSNGVYDTEKRIKLAFVCLLTAVGIPMILAGDEFADRHDLDFYQNDRYKQVDPVNYNRLQTDDWRKRIFDYVKHLVKFRTTSDALASNDTDFIHADFNEGKRVIVWKRGYGEKIVVVVANFSDYGTPNIGDPNAQYVVPNFPATPPGKQWKEITQDRVVPNNWIGREPIFPWEAKVYALE